MGTLSAKRFCQFLLSLAALFAAAGAWTAAFAGMTGVREQAVASATEAKGIECASDMVEIDGTFCIDRYEYPNEEGATPLGGVTWLQALAKCRAQGKRLCTSAEWQRVCSGPSGGAYPYGNEYDRRRCVSGRDHRRGSAPSGSHPDCKSEEGVYDLSGNLWEWTGTEPTEAALAGGGWMTDGAHSRCDSRTWVSVPRSVNFTYGFRCCARLKKRESGR